MHIPPIDSPNTTSLRPSAAARLRGTTASTAALVEQASTIVRLSPVARRLGSDYRDPNLEPGHQRRGPGQAALEYDPTASRTNEEQSAAQAIQRAFSRTDGVDPSDPDQQGHARHEDSGPPSEAPDSQSTNGRGQQKHSGPRSGHNLTDNERTEVENLRRRDREVRAHEAAHQAAAGGLAGAAKFETAVGPDGRTYAINGEVPINVSPGRTPEETIKRMQQVQRAAMAPADPSGQDMSVASRASRLISQARMDGARRDAEISRSERRTRPERPEPRLGRALPGEENANPNEVRGPEETGITTAPQDTALAPAPKSFMDHVEEMASRVEITRRSGGVGGGHIHASLNCGFCSRGLAAYVSNVA